MILNTGLRHSLVHAGDPGLTLGMLVIQPGSLALQLSVKFLYTTLIHIGYTSSPVGSTQDVGG